MLSGNKGEWSELWVLCNLIETGQLATADSRLVPNFDQITTIERIKLKTRHGELIFTPFDRLDPATSHLNIVGSLDRNWFAEQCEAFQQELLDPSKVTTSFQAGNALAQALRLPALKANSGEKVDIWLDLATPHGLQPTALGYSIKSQVGGSSTLLNAGGATNFIYELHDFHGLAGALNKTSSKNRVREVVNLALANSSALTFVKCDSQTFTENMQMLSNDFPEDLASMLLDYYKGTAPTLFDAFTHICAQRGNATYERNLRYRLGEFLNAVALGMTPAKQWNGSLAGYGGYIVVKRDSSIVGLHLANKQELIMYLLQNTKFETPSTSRHGFGDIYYENGRFFIKLNLQIRFI